MTSSTLADVALPGLLLHGSVRIRVMKCGVPCTSGGIINGIPQSEMGYK